MGYSEQSAIVSVEDMNFGYDHRLIFNDVNLKIARGKIIAIMGPSGTGKTTLLRLIAGQLQPNSGQISVFNENIHELSRVNLYQLRRRMGLLFQTGALFTNLSVFENVAFSLREHAPLSESLLRDLVLLKLEAVGLRGARDLMPSALSGGMVRRVALARTLAMDPELVMYDEPFAGQDPITMGVLLKLIKELNDSLGLTSVIVSHDVKEAASIADYIYIISGGTIIAEGEPEDLMNSDQPEAQQFLKGLPEGVVPLHYPAQPIAEDFA